MATPGAAVDQRLFSGCHNGITIALDYSTGEVVGTFPIGQRVDANQFDPGTSLVFTSSGDGTITVAHEDSPINMELGLHVEIGMLSMCPLSNLFDASQGSAEGQLSGMIEASRFVGSRIVRAVVGNAKDRRSSTPFAEILRKAVRVLRSVRSRDLDSGISIAIEKHSGDMQAWELKQLIEDAGTDFVGACLDSGNPLITLEDPLVSLEILAPCVLTSHIRDSRVWLMPNGAAGRAAFRAGNQRQTAA